MLPWEIRGDSHSRRNANLAKFVIDSSGTFRSYDLGVMGPARFHCATLLKGGRKALAFSQNKQPPAIATKAVRKMACPLKAQNGLLVDEHKGFAV